VKADLFYLEHILDCIHKIERFCKDGEARFFESDLIQDAVLRNLQVLGESTKRLSEGLRLSTQLLIGAELPASATFWFMTTLALTWIVSGRSSP